MNILMMTNTYLPHVGGVARSVAVTTKRLRERGHSVLVVAPTFRGAPRREAGVMRVPAIQRFNGSDFSVRLPIPGLLSAALDRFSPDLVHAHHPFLMGDTALRTATRRNLPLVFTHHTMYEQYTHYVPGNSPRMAHFVVHLGTDFANLCDHIIAPSESIGTVLETRGVHTPISVVPTGTDTQFFASGDRAAARRQYGIPADAWVVGHVGRLAPEKSPEMLARAVGRHLAEQPRSYFLIVGDGPAREEIQTTAARLGITDRLIMPGALQGQALADAYAVMDVFAFTSQTETQGMVLAEALAAGVPVVALDAPGARDIVADRRNGRLLPADADERAFAAALNVFADASERERAATREQARQDAESFSLSCCVDRLMEVYNTAANSTPRRRQVADNPWQQTRRLIEAEWNLWSRRSDAALNSLRGDQV